MCMYSEVAEKFQNLAPELIPLNKAKAVFYLINAGSCINIVTKYLKA